MVLKRLLNLDAKRILRFHDRISDPLGQANAPAVFKETAGAFQEVTLP
jgi:hypothetical protein